MPVISAGIYLVEFKIWRFVGLFALLFRSNPLIIRLVGVFSA